MQFIFIIAEIFFSYFVIVRLADEFIERNLIVAEAKRRINVIFIAWIVIAAALFSDRRMYFSIFLWLVVILLTLYPRILLRMRTQKFREDVFVLIKHMILKMRMGQSFRAALKDAIGFVSHQSRYQFEKIYESLVHKSAVEVASPALTSRDVSRLVHTFSAIDMSTHNSLNQLIHFRERLTQEKHFQSRVNRALSQVYAQATILLLLYLGLLIVVVLRFGFQNNARLIVLSILISALGHIWALKLGRGFRWKV